MVAGHLREKNGYYYAVLNYNDAFGKRKTKWIATGLTVKGNKKKAEAFLMEERQKLQPEEPVEGDIFFADYMEQWLDVVKSSIAVATFSIMGQHFFRGPLLTGNSGCDRFIVQQLFLFFHPNTPSD